MSRIPRFSLGTVVLTDSVNDLLGGNPDKIQSVLDRHAAGDWGHVSALDAADNDRALTVSGGLTSAYDVVLPDTTTVELMVVTDAGHDVTTVLLPSDY